MISGQRKWKVQNIQFQKDLSNAKNVNSKLQIVSASNNNNNINNNNSNSRNNNNISLKQEKGQKGSPGKLSRPSSKNEASPRGENEKKDRTGQKQENSSRVSQKTASEVKKPFIESHANGHHDGEDFDSCSCVTCNTCQQSDCSCSEVSNSSQSSRCVLSITLITGNKSPCQVVPLL